VTAASRQVREFQRIRILSAMVAVACDHGVQSATVGRVIAEAGVSRKTFDELFEDRDGCLLEAIEQTVALAAQRARAAYETQLSWVDRMRAGLQALLEFFDEEPALAQLCVVQSTTAGPAALARRRQLLDQLAGIVDEGRTVASREPPAGRGGRRRRDARRGPLAAAKARRAGARGAAGPADELHRASLPRQWGCPQGASPSSPDRSLQAERTGAQPCGGA
jgi:AcrR family transcriptional regulator